MTRKAKKGTIADRMRTGRERNPTLNRELAPGEMEAAVSGKKLNIYPPEFPDPLKPGGVSPRPRAGEKPGVPPDPDAVARDAYLGQLAADVAAGEADSPEPEADPGAGSTVPLKANPQGGGS